MENQGIDLSNIRIRFLARDILSNMGIIILLLCSVWMGIEVYAKTTYVPNYTSMATLAIGAQTGSGVYDYTSFGIAQEMTDIFSEVFKSELLIDKVESVMGVEELNGKIVTQIVTNTNLLRVGVSSSSPEDSYKILNLILDNYEAVSNNLFGNAVLVIVKEPKIPMTHSNILSVRRAQTVGVFVAFVLLVGIIVVFSLLKQTVKTKVTAIKKIDGHLLGTIGNNKEWNSKKIFAVKVRKNRSNGLLINSSKIKTSIKESFGSLAIKLDYYLRKDNKKIILICSAGENEGKTTVAANLALALSEKKKKVLLVDCDFRKPAVHRIFNKNVNDLNDFGSFMQDEKVPICEYQHEKYENLYLAVNKAVCPLPQRIITSEKMKKYIEEMREEMDCIILDSPPILVAADAEALAEIADYSVMIIKQNHTPINDINESIACIKQHSADFAGYILNDFI